MLHRRTITRGAGRRPSGCPRGDTASKAVGASPTLPPVAKPLETELGNAAVEGTSAGLDPLRTGRLYDLAERMAKSGTGLTVEAPGLQPIGLGTDPQRSRVVFRDAGAVDALLEGRQLALAEAYLEQRLDVHGSLEDVIQVTDHLADATPSRLREVLWWLRSLLDRRGLDRRSVAHHYDRPPDFFLDWLERTRSYTHGFYVRPDDDPTEAQVRKLQYAIDSLGLEPGMEVFDMGCGWGSFLEYAGARGIHVQGITLSREQHAFVSERIRQMDLPCRIEYVDFLDYRPGRSFDGAVFMGSLEHLADYRHVARFLRAHVRPQARVYCDFVASKQGRLSGPFMSRYIFPGVSNYVDVPRLVQSLTGAGFDVSELADDTLSCAYTVRDWARRLERQHAALAARHGELPVRAFLLYLWSSYHFLLRNRTQAYHLVASRVSRPLPHARAAASATATAARQSTPKRSPTRP
jgi:cyclopropane-fatty-acyl-phospholipid synthase